MCAADVLTVEWQSTTYVLVSNAWLLVGPYLLFGFGSLCILDLVEPPHSWRLSFYPLIAHGTGAGKPSLSSAFLRYLATVLRFAAAMAVYTLTHMWRMQLDLTSLTLSPLSHRQLCSTRGCRCNVTLHFKHHWRQQELKELPCPSRSA
jgi:hypothetical protein